MSYKNLVRFVTFLGIFTMALRVAVFPDTWWHLRSGAWMIENEQILRQDPFSLTRQGQAWVYPGWLSQIALYGIFHTFGYAGLNIFTAMMVLLAFVFVWHSLEGADIFRAFVLLLAATAAGVYWSARPHIISFALTGAWVLLLEKTRKGQSKLLWFLPPLMILWANVHGGFAIGFLLLGIYLIGEGLETIRPVLFGTTHLKESWRSHKRRVYGYLVAGIGCTLAVCLNPHGPVMLLYPFKTVSIQTLQDYIVEWQSPSFHMIETHPFLWMLLITMLVLGTSGKKRHSTEFLLVGTTAYLSFMAARNISLFAIAAAPVLARHGYAAIEPLLSKSKSEFSPDSRYRKILNATFALLLLLAAGLKAQEPLQKNVNLEHIQRQIPVEAIEYIKSESLPGPLFNSYNWGGYVTWSLYPDYRSFVDGRTDLFGDEILQSYLTVWRGDPGWQEILTRWNVKLVLLETEAPITRILIQEGWEIRYEDPQAILLSIPSG